MNRIKTIQEMLMREMDRLDDNKLMACNGKNEVARSNALSATACTFIKSANLGIRIMEVSKEQNKTIEALNKELGVENEE